MATVYVLDEFQKENLIREIDKASTLDELKEAFKSLLKELPIEYE